MSIVRLPAARNSHATRRDSVGNRCFLSPLGETNCIHRCKMRYSQTRSTDPRISGAITSAARPLVHKNNDLRYSSRMTRHISAVCWRSWLGPASWARLVTTILPRYCSCCLGASWRYTITVQIITLSLLYESKSEFSCVTEAHEKIMR